MRRQGDVQIGANGDPNRGQAQRDSRGGFALMAVLLVVLSLLVLCAPFLMSARNADRASAHLADRAEARVLLDGAARHARAKLGASHPGMPDLSPYADSLTELAVDNLFDEGFMRANDPAGPMWDLDVRDVAGLIDLNSAPPQVLANAMGLITRTSDVMADSAEELALNESGGFGTREGFLVIQGELIHYTLDEQGEVTIRTRGVNTQRNEEGNWVTQGPRPPSSHPVGAHVMDQRVFAPVIWRITGPSDQLRTFDTLEQLRESDSFAMAGAVGEGGYSALGDVGSVHAGVCAGGAWQKPVRLVSTIEGGLTLSLAVDDARYINEGATIWIGDHTGGELRYVQLRTDNGRIFFDRVLDQDYDAWETEVRVLSRRPVNINTAPELVLRALFENLQLRNTNSRITSGEAQILADLTIESRPFEGLEDWMRRIVLPVAGIEELPAGSPVTPDRFSGTGGAILSSADALALYVNGLNANDAALSFSTMPFCFTSRDVYAMDLRASVNAPSGIERTHASRQRVEWVAPQRELFSMWGTQEAFDEALRLNRRAAWWATGPKATSQWDGGTVPPSRLWPHMGTRDGRVYLPGFDVGDAATSDEALAEHIFASRDEEAWIQLWPSRLPEQWRYRGHALHFDRETRHLEGRYLPDETLGFVIDDRRVSWANASTGGLMLPALFELWVKPTVLGGGYLLDVGGTSREADRFSLLLEGDDLVLRVWDGFGDHLATPGFKEVSEVRFPLAEGDDPGLPIDTWSHIAVNVLGTRPDQLGMFVNGSTSGVRHPGQTRLTSGANQGASFIAVEDTEGFPQRGVVRLGNELVEYTLAQGGFQIAHLDAGPDAGQGGRLARTRWGVDGIPAFLGGITTNHPLGTTVSLYGYSAPLASNFPAGASSLLAALGSFRVARVVGVDNTIGTGPDPILGGFQDFGDGYEARNMSGLILALGDDPTSTSDGTEVMSAFSSTGGYAALVQQRWSFDQTGNSSVPPNAPLGGLEIIRYSGYTDTTLNVVARGAVVAQELPNYGALDPSGFAGGTRVYVIDWEGTVNGNGDLVQNQMNMGCYCVPISLPTPGADDLTYLPAINQSEFVQLTRPDAAEMTEWVRYDTIATAQGQLVRDRQSALLNLYATLTLSQRALRNLQGSTNGGGGGGGGGGVGGGGGGQNAPGGPPPGEPPPPPPGVTPPAASSTGPPAAALGAVWDPLRGDSELDNRPLSRAVWSTFQFRGVLGTHAHDHPAGTQILPVIHLPDRGVDGGRPGAGDAVFVSGASATHLGWPMVVERGHLPAAEYTAYGWQQDPGRGLVAVPSSPETYEINHTEFQVMHIYVAFDNPCPESIAAGAAGTTATDPRLLARVTKFPSGERPRVVSTVAVGSTFDAQGGEVPAVVVDEVAFGSQQFLRGLPGTQPSSHSQGAQMILATAIDESTEQITVAPTSFFIPGGVWGGARGVLSNLDDDGGLLRVGEEIMAYFQRDETTGQVAISPGGRGMMGTRPQPHQPTEAVTFLEGWAVSSLTAGIGPADANVPVQSAVGFGTKGTVLIGDELVHYTRQRSGSLEMPRTRYAADDQQERSSSGSAGSSTADEGRGQGMFRGRYGTVPGTHVAGSAVIRFPFRYWDRWVDEADAPELSYFAFELEQPGAWWSETFWDDEPATHGQCHVGVLQRTDPDTPWDADPEEERGLQVLYEGRDGNRPLPLGVQSDRIEWRVFVRYDPGAFDPLTGRAHGWKETPRLKRLGVSYRSPGQVLWSVDR